jgi:trigger factor
MNLQKNQTKPSEVELKIEINFTEYQPYLDKAAKRLSDNLKIEGFRPGKAPFFVVEQKVGLMKIYEEALDDVISFFYWQAVVREKLDTVGQPKIDLEKLAPGNPIVFKATAALMPEVKLADYKSVKVKRNEVKIEDQELERAIQDLRKMQVKETLEDKAVETGDRVEVDFTVSLDRVVIENGVGKKYPLVIGSNNMIPGFEKEIISLKANQEKEFELTFPKEYQDKMVAGKKCEFKVKVLAVYKQELPEVNDEWAKAFGAKDLADLKGNISKNYLIEKKNHEEQRVEMELLSKVTTKSEFTEIPEFLIENEAHRMVHEFGDSISYQGINFDDYLKSIKKDHEELEKEFRPKAEERVRTSLVIKQIAEQEKIEVTELEVEAEVNRIVSQLDSEEAKNNTKSDGYKQYVRNVIRNQKVIEMLKKQCIE